MSESFPVNCGITQNDTFHYDLKIGNNVEGTFARILLLCGDKIEVKSDRLAHKTGNVFIEYESRGKPSGLSTSHAEWWVFEIQNCFHVIPAKQLKEIARKYIQTERDIKGGDDNTSKGILLPITELL